MQVQPQSVSFLAFLVINNVLILPTSVLVLNKVHCMLFKLYCLSLNQVHVCFLEESTFFIIIDKAINKQPPNRPFY